MSTEPVVAIDRLRTSSGSGRRHFAGPCRQRPACHPATHHKKAVRRAFPRVSLGKDQSIFSAVKTRAGGILGERTHSGGDTSAAFWICAGSAMTWAFEWGEQKKGEIGSLITRRTRVSNVVPRQRCLQLQGSAATNGSCLEASESPSADTSDGHTKT